MLGLVAYESSDEDESTTKTQSSQYQHDLAKESAGTKVTSEKDVSLHDKDRDCAVPQSTAQSNEVSTVPGGPLLGPSQPQDPGATLQHMVLETNQLSPGSNARSLIHQLTLPSIPDLDIPASPPGSPDPTANSKFIHFGTLKSQGIHFNAKLATSSSLKNPNLLQTMRRHAGIEDEEQYATSLPTDIWHYSLLPQWGFKEELLKTQKTIRVRVEEEKAMGPRGGPIEFVPSSAAHHRPAVGNPEMESSKDG